MASRAGVIRWQVGGLPVIGRKKTKAQWMRETEKEVVRGKNSSANLSV